MLRVASIALALVASLVFVESLSAQQNGRGHRNREGFPSFIQMVEKNKDLKLTDDQKTKLAALDKQYAPKSKELVATMDKVLTADQKKARKEALDAARKAGKRGPEVRESIQAAMKLSDAQKAKLADGRKAMQTLNKEIRGKVSKVLTPEQLEVLKKARPHRGGHRNHGESGNKQQPSQVN
jgi:Spy/CpxP family protein refolding chaperone